MTENKIFSEPSEEPNVEVEHFDHYRSGATSVHSDSSWDSYADYSSHTTQLSQEEILEEIQRECAEIERRSSSPLMQKTTRSKVSSSINLKYTFLPESFYF